jgi:diguanylate cyclase (GGDEF)-like protein
VVLVDLDDLAAINAAGGTSAGDEVLRGVGARLREAFRDSDLVARWRDDEFALLLPATDLATAKRFLARAQALLTTEPPAGPDGVERPVTLSAGIGVARPGMPLDAAIAAADRALSLAKASGPSTVRSEEDDRPTGPVSVLIAEDDRVSATLVRHRLERAGYLVTHCLDGNDALATAGAGAFGLFILDIRMPGMDGIELLKRLRATVAYARTPVIMLTSVGREEDIVRAFNLGASDYVTKPFSPVELLARAQRLVREHAAGAAS